jgi:hypothetical protein
MSGYPRDLGTGHSQGFMGTPYHADMRYPSNLSIPGPLTIPQGPPPNAPHHPLSQIYSFLPHDVSLSAPHHHDNSLLPPGGLSQDPPHEDSARDAPGGNISHDTTHSFSNGVTNAAHSQRPSYDLTNGPTNGLSNRHPRGLTNLTPNGVPDGPYSGYQYGEASQLAVIPAQQEPPHLEVLSPATVQLSVRQQPEQALVSSSKNKSKRKPVEPPTVVMMSVQRDVDPTRIFLHNPHLFVKVVLTSETGAALPANRWDGSASSSLSSFKASDGDESKKLEVLQDFDDDADTLAVEAFFAFTDLSIYATGSYKLRLVLFERRVYVHQRGPLARTDNL